MSDIARMKADIASIKVVLNQIINDSKRTDEFDPIVLPAGTNDLVRILRNGVSYKVSLKDLIEGDIIDEGAIDVTWLELVSRITRQAGDVYNITTAPANGIIYGVVYLLTKSTFNYWDGQFEHSVQIK